MVNSSVISFSACFGWIMFGFSVGKTSVQLQAKLGKPFQETERILVHVVGSLWIYNITNLWNK